MSRKVILELDDHLVNNEIIIYKDDMLKSVEIHRLLPDLKKIKEEYKKTKEEVAELKQTIAELAKIIKEK